jgi:DNA-directed RNA polymerase subunit RPC12/RpoP
MKATEARVLVGMPNYTNTLNAEVYANHIHCTKEWTKAGIDFQFMIVGRDFVHFARTKICQVARDGGWTHILWLDDDAIIEPHILAKYIEHDKDIIVTPYPMRRSPYEIGCLISVRYDCQDCGHKHYTEQAVPEVEAECPECGGPLVRDFYEMGAYKNMCLEDIDCGLVEIDGGGTHAMLIKTDMLWRVPEQKFDPVAPDLRKLMTGLNEQQRAVMRRNIGDLPEHNLSFDEEEKAGKHYFTMPPVGTEDMLFCYRAKLKGMEVWCDTDEWADHVGFAPVITKAYRQGMEQVRTGQAKNVNHGVAVLNVVKGRDNNSVRVDTNVSLV